MFKVIVPMERREGGHFWMRLGSAFTNKDDSINVYLDALPLAGKDGKVKLQIRELTEEDLRERENKRSAFDVSRASLSQPTSAIADSTRF
jgi:hypothetical protein